jgi:predicted small secreted protein
LNARKALLAVAALMTATLTSCGTARRAGKDAFVGVATVIPVLPIYGGASDGYASAKHIREGIGGGAAMEVLAFPFTFTYHFLEHAIYGVIHIVDLPLCLFYGAAELNPNSIPVKPLDYYQGTWFDEEPKRSGTDAESGEKVPPGYNRH